MKAACVLLLLVLVCSCFAQSTVDFTLSMTGSCVNTGSGDLNTFCTAKGNSQSITTIVSAVSGVTQTVSNKIGSYAVLNMNVTSLVENSFIGVGNMSFGTHLRREHTLEFQSLGVGFNYPTNNTFVYSFGATFTSFGSGGVFNHAHGTLTMNGYINFYTTAWTIFVNGIIYDVGNNGKAFSNVEELVS